MSMVSAVASPRICIVACEASGDLLGARLVQALRQVLPDAQFAGVAGDQMRAAGVEAWADTADLSVMGITEVLKHLPRLLKLRASILERAVEWKADILIGVDGPDFNIGLERRARARGLRTVHYVSPSIWAWREGRAKKLQEAADEVLCLFPMEPPIYAKYGAQATFVGHPLADEFPLEPDRAMARQTLGLAAEGEVLGILPGSRLGEISKLGAIFLAAAARLRRVAPGLRLVAPMANERCRAAFEELLRSPLPPVDSGAVEGAQNSAGTRLGVGGAAISQDEWAATCAAVHVVDGQSHAVMVASDLLLLASGTAALEGLLSKRPMVVAYKIAPLTHFIVKGLGILKVDRYSLPNILSGERLVPELMQEDCTPAAIASELARLRTDPAVSRTLLPRFLAIHEQLRKDSSVAAAQAIAALLGGEGDTDRLVSTSRSP